MARSRVLIRRPRRPPKSRGLFAAKLRARRFPPEPIPYVEVLFPNLGFVSFLASVPAGIGLLAGLRHRWLACTHHAMFQSVLRKDLCSDSILQVQPLSLIHISEPTRRTPISYAVFCLKKK